MFDGLDNFQKLTEAIPPSFVQLADPKAQHRSDPRELAAVVGLFAVEQEGISTRCPESTGTLFIVPVRLARVAEAFFEVIRSAGTWLTERSRLRTRAPGSPLFTCPSETCFST
jgi:hypothetical protein